MALPQKYRLKKDRDIKKVFSKGKTVKGGLFFIKSLANDLPYSRLAVIVSKKVSGKATQRNLIKRKIYSAVEKKYFPKNSIDFTITALPPILGKEFQEIKSEVDKATKLIFGQI